MTPPELALPAAEATVYPARQSARVWLPLALLLGVLLYVPIFPPLVREWSQFAHLSHGFASPFVAGYLLWIRRDRLLGEPAAPTLWGLPLLLAGAGALVVGARGDESFVARISLPVTLLGITAMLGGLRIARQAAPGILYLLFMMPLPWSTVKLMTYRSRLLDASLSAQALGWLGVPVYRDGVYLHLPNIVLEVADECSSIPAIAALLSLGVAYASVSARPLGARIVLAAATLPFAVLSNVIRIVTTALAAQYIGTWTLQTLYHQFYGTVNFLLTLLLLLTFDAALGRLTSGRRA
jgi:exosortase